MFYVFKGKNADSGESEDRCWIYHPCNNRWEQNPGKLNEMRQDAVGKVFPNLLLGTERPWILGGQRDSNNVSSSTEYYNGNQKKWIISENNYLQEEKFGACAANTNSTIQADEIVLIGGKKTFRQVESFFGDDGRNRSAEGDTWNNCMQRNKYKFRLICYGQYLINSGHIVY